MARIKINDLPVLEDLSAKETKGIFGGYTTLAEEIDEGLATEEDASTVEAFVFWRTRTQ